MLRLRMPKLPTSAAANPAGQSTVAKRRNQPAVAYIARLTGAAVFGYLLALFLTGSSRPILAALTAMLVVQATLFQTIHTAVRRVSAVAVGVIVAVAVTAYAPFNWWVLGLLIAASLGIGMILHLGEEIIEVPISAMLVFSVNAHSAATTRVLDTLVGAAAGLVAGMVYAPLRIQPAKDAVGELTREMSELLEQMASGLTAVPEQRHANEWLERTRALRGEIERVDDALEQAEESIRLNPRQLASRASRAARGKRAEDPAAGLREGVTTLERAATDMRVLARSVADSTRLDSDHSPVRQAQTRTELATLLGELSGAVKVYGELIETTGEATGDSTAAQLEQHLEAAQRHQDQLADLLHSDSAERTDSWPLRGELLAHVDRLRTELQSSRPPDRSDSTGPQRVLRLRQPGRAKRSDRVKHPTV
jgi:uncharacterized membrane protein YgaE (UPF0421/DUF939 family)